jgi:hypothetical protein
VLGDRRTGLLGHALLDRFGLDERHRFLLAQRICSEVTHFVTSWDGGIAIEGRPVGHMPGQDLQNRRHSRRWHR